MPKINLLSFEVANLIAAGEVVDRPASAIKEMIENSIDAGASHITVEIQNGGITFMRITDDGCGIEQSDLPLAIKRHATSKIQSAADLDGICTLGFRGEALAAISAVADVRIISKTRDAEMGAELEVHYGEVYDVTERGASNGTTIIVENLFANVPARRKFLKKDVTETSAVSANVERIALSHPEIAFKLICDGQVKLETAGDGELMSAIYAVFGRDFANRLIEVEGECDGISVSGYIGRSDNVKGNRNYENFYINKRYIKSRTASAAIEQAFSSYMSSEKFPVCVLSITLNPSRVDVNVHPAKLEVKFSNEKPVFEAVYYAVKHALEYNITRPQIVVQKNNFARMSEAFAPVEREQSLKKRQLSIDNTPIMANKGHIFANVEGQKSEKKPDIATEFKSEPSKSVQRLASKPEAELPKYEAQTESKPNISFTPEEYVKLCLMETDEQKEAYKKASAEYCFSFEEFKQKQGFSELDKIAKEMDGRGVSAADIGEQVSENNTSDIPSGEFDAAEGSLQAAEQGNEKALQHKANYDDSYIPPQYKIVGEAFNSYIIVEVGEMLLLIDKHAAHERIIFEQLKANMYSSDVPSQLLMLPIEVMLMSDEVAAIEEYRREIEAVGFEFTTSRNSVSVDSLPMGIEQDAVADMLTVIADRIKNGTGNVDITRNLVFERALYQASCKAAIKAGREYPAEHQKWVVEKLMQIPDITFCPHGRPVAMELTKKSIDRQFERT